MNDLDTLRNLNVFMDRVQITGKQENAVFAHCCNWIQAKLKEEEAKAQNSKGTEVELKKADKKAS